MRSEFIDNALRYSPDGAEIKLVLEGADGKNNGAFSFIINNSWVSLTKEQCKLMLEPFYRVNKSKENGAGIGLAIVSWIVKLHRLVINCHSYNNHVEIYISK